jgi:DNA-binding CsgD family transcriptional regulator
MLRRALDEIDDQADRGHLLTRLSDLELLTADFPAAAAHATEALSIASTPTERLVATLASAQALAATSGCSAAVELVEAEAEHLGETDADVKFELRAAAVVLRACADAPPGPDEDALTGVEALLGETKSERALLAGLASLAILAGDASATHINRACARVLTNRGETPSGAISDLADYLACRAALLADVGDLVEHFLQRIPQNDGDAAEAGGRPAYLGLRAQLALSRGELAEAETSARAALTLLGDLPPTALHRRVRADLLAVVAAAAIERSNHEEAEQALSELLGAEDGPSPAATSLRLALALAQSLPALEIASAAADGHPPAGLVAPGISWRPLAALAHHAAGDCSRAVALATDHLRHAEAWGIPSVLGRALAVRGVVDPGPERLSFVEEAVAVLEGTSAQLDLASATVELGAALRRAGRRRESRERLVSAADLAHRCGAHALAARARLELVSLGARPRRAAFSGVSSLTAAELRVARLAAAGLTNRAIAQALIVSVKTVSGQLTSVYRKLEVHDRAALVPAMQQDDDPEPTPEAVH